MGTIVQPGTAAFWLALLVIAGLGIVELVSMLLGASVSSLLDDGFSHHTPGESHSGLLGSWMSWLNAGGVPVLVLAVILLAAFAVAGFVIQAISSAAIIGPMPDYAAITGALAAAIPVTRWASRALAKIIPRDETSVLHQSDFIGLVGTVTLGPLDQGNPGTVRVKDRYDNIHSLRAKAAVGYTIATGEHILIVDGSEGLFEAIPAPAELNLSNNGQNGG